MTGGTAKEQLQELEVELDERVAALPIAQVPARALLAVVHQILDGFIKGDLPNDGPPDPPKADAFGGRIFGLGPVLRAMPPAVGGNIAEALEAYAQADPEHDQLRLLLGYGPNEWVGQSGGRAVPKTKASTKADALKKTTAAAKKSATPTKPVSVRIHKQNGQFQEERTYPRSADPPQSKG
jgi:hypothetical protein